MSSIDPAFAQKVELAWQGKMEVLALLDAANALVAAGQHALAAVLCQTWLSRNHSPLEHFIYFNLGVALATTGDSDGAMEAYDQAIRLDPAFLQPRFNRALILQSQGKAEAAYEEWQWVAAQARPEAPDQQALKAQALLHLADLAERLAKAPHEVQEPAPQRGLTLEVRLQVDAALGDEVALALGRSLILEAMGARSAQGLPTGVTAWVVAEPAPPGPVAEAVVPVAEATASAPAQAPVPAPAPDGPADLARRALGQVQAWWKKTMEPHA